MSETTDRRLTPKDFGAIGDGITDDTAAIQAYQNYIDAHESKTTKYALRISHRHTGDDLLVLPLTDEQARELRDNMDEAECDHDGMPLRSEPLWRISVWVDVINDQ